ncbi:MAG TPA: hypothetical protein DCE80_16825, partial [Ignavibacteriales bacterium]|nr:hypothetical protein [Ignavibacteriales bacterium]
HCQFLDSTLIKTRPLQDFIGYNPNISLEKPIGPKNSFEVDLMYRNRTWYSNGGEWDFGQFMPSTGYRILGGFRHYISKKKKAPFGFFLGSSVVVKYSMMKDIEMESFEGLYTNTQDVELFQVELIPVFGYQYHISKRISSEFYLGPAFWLFRRESTTVVDSPNPEEIGLTEQMDNGYG